MPVQSVAIPLLLQERDVIGLAPTGTGKTVAFAVPSLATLDLNDRGPSGIAAPRILVLCPTRELTQQTAVVFHVLGGGNVRVAECFGGSDRDRQAKDLQRGCEVVVATPGRLCDFLESGTVTLDRLTFLVFDEADRMLEMGFTSQLEYIMSRVKPENKRRTMMWSATWPESVKRIAMEYLDRSHVRITAGDPRSNKSIEQRFYVLPEPQRLPKLLELLDKGPIERDHKAIIFMARKTTIDDFCDEVRQSLSWMNPKSVQTLHGGQRQERRDKVIAKFREGSIRILIATEVAARGLDVPDVEHVINYDVPGTIERYIHRIGRTGRAGRKGMAHTFLSEEGSSPAEADFATELLQYMKENKLDPSPELQNYVSSQVRGQRDRSMAKRGFRGGGGGGGRLTHVFNVGRR